MKIIHRYICGQLARTFLISLVVFTFILFMGNVIRILDLLERGVAGGLLMKLFLSFFPYLLVFSIPMALLTASLLVFGRFSADHEITAMRSCGIGFYTIFKSGFIIALVLTAVCGIINTVIAPRAHYVIRKLRYQVGEQSPEALLEPGVFIDYFKPYQFYIGQREGRLFRDVIIYEKVEDGRTRFLTANRGEIESGEGKQVVLTLYDGTMEEPPKERGGAFLSAKFRTYIVRMGVGGDAEQVPKKLADYTFTDLRKRIARFSNMSSTASPMLQRDLIRRVSILRTEMSERFVYTFCVLAFLMIGMPLGITTHRAETSIGAAISLALVGLNYSFIICVEALQERAWLYPHVLVWVPNMVFVILGPALTYRLSRS